MKLHGAVRRCATGSSGSTKPIIAAVNGFALGGGLELAMACTLRVAAETAKLGQPEVNLGLLPGFGGTQRLPRLVGPGRALEMLLTGEPVDATEAWRMGLVNRVVPAGRVRDEARELAGLLASKPPLVMQYILDVVRSGMQMSLQDGVRTGGDTVWARRLDRGHA